MEPAAGSPAAIGRPISLGIPPQSSRKEWRAVSDHPATTTGNESRDAVPVEFCAITLDRNLGEDILQQRLHDVVRRREELQRDEVELRAQFLARKEILAVQKEYDAKMKEQINANTKLQEKLLEVERTLHELQRQIEQKEREIQAIQLDHEAAWAKEDLLREQNKELLTYRRERDNSEAERAQHLKQILDLKEHFQEKERIYLELQEQHRIAQENILFKDEQLGEAQTWIARFQEMQSTSSHSLQTELRERTEQYNQLWISCQQQFSEMERLYVHTIHQLQLELASARERSGSFPDESHLSQIKSKDDPQLGQNNGTQTDVNGSGTTGASYGPLSNGNPQNVVINSPNQTEHVHGVPLAPPPSLISMPTYLQPGQVSALHPFVMHHQGVHHPVQSHVGHIHSIPTMSPLQQWQNNQAVSEASLLSNQHEYPSSQTEQNLIRSDINYDYDVSGNEQSVHAEFLGSKKVQGMEPNSSVHSSTEIDSADRSYVPDSRSHQSLQHISSQFNDRLRQEPDSGNDVQEIGTNNLSKTELENKDFMPGQSNPTSNAPPLTEKPNNPTPGADAFISSEQNNSHGSGIITIDLLDERSLLACIVRTIPPPETGGRIKMSSTLPNRLGKMLAPLHWHDYKKKYGKLDEFLASHHELFVIEGDYIQVREGAQEMISAKAAVAKIAAAAKTVAFANPSVAVTPMAAHSSQQRLKKTPSISSNGGNISGIKILSKTKDPLPQVLNEVESRLGQSSGLSTLANGVVNHNHPKSGTNFVAKPQQTRATAVSMGSRR